MPVVRIEPGGVEANLLPGEAILAGLNRCGITVRKIGCRRGGCGICKTDLVSGTVTYERVVAESVLSTEEREQGKCLTCRAVPEGDVTVHLSDDDDVRTQPLGLLRYLNLPTSSQPAAPLQRSN